MLRISCGCDCGLGRCLQRSLEPAFQRTTAECVMVFMARGGGLLWLEITMRFLARRHERRCLLTGLGRASTIFPCRKSTSASRHCRRKSHGLRTHEEPNKPLSARPPLFLKSTSRAEAIGSDSLLVCEKHRMVVATQRACHGRRRSLRRTNRTLILLRCGALCSLPSTNTHGRAAF